MFISRDNQDEAVDYGLTDKGAPILCAPTGSGKTLIALWMARDFLNRGKRVVIMTPREEILKQFMESADHIVGPCQTGIVQSGQPRSPYHPLQICSWPTLRSWAVRAAENKRDLTMVLLPADLIIVDEAHLSVTQQMYSFVLMHYLQTAAKIVGVTATPSGKNLGLVYTSIKHVTSVRTLIKDGHTQQVPSFTN